jgi:hypothetical protein
MSGMILDRVSNTIIQQNKMELGLREMSYQWQTHL